MSSVHLNTNQIRGLIKAGDIIIPGTPGFPSFSQSGYIRKVDRLVHYMSEFDRKDLLMLLTVFAYVPTMLIRLLLWTAANNNKFPKSIGKHLKLLDIGVKGVVYSLYYSEKDIHQKIGYHTYIHREGKMTEEKRVDAEQTFHTARQAAKDWSQVAPAHRGQAMGRLREVIIRRQDEILDAIQKDTGKCRTDAHVSEIFSTLDHLSFLEAQTAKCLADESVPTPIALMGKKSRVYYESLGVVLIISPWNYPFAMALMPITTALAAGNAVVYKPSEFTPLTGLLESLFNEAGFAPEQMQVVYGDGKVGASLIDMRPDKIFFTGSVATGKKIMAQASENLIPVELELGGKDPMIVFPDVSLERTTAGALWGAFTNMGQACTSVERLYVHGDIFNAFRDRLVAKVMDLRQAADTDGDSDLGRMTTEFQVQTIKKHLDDALAKGAVQLTGKDWDGESSFVPPIVLENVTEEMLVAKDESFGPIVPMFKFTDEEDVIARANNSPFGLSASVWTTDMKRAERVTRALVTGNVSVNNVMLTEGNSNLPFGGVRESGFGRYRGKFGLHSFSNIKSVIYDKNSDKIEANWFPYTKRKLRLFKDMTSNLYAGTLVKFPQFVFKALSLESYADKIGKKGRSA